MGNLLRSAPIFPVADLRAAMDHYRRLGFTAREYEGGGYGYVNRGPVEIHLTEVRGLEPRGVRNQVYLWVEDADALAHEWESAGVKVSRPRDTDWGQHEGWHQDPDCNLIRFGSPAGAT